MVDMTPVVLGVASVVVGVASVVVHVGVDSKVLDVVSIKLLLNDIVFLVADVFVGMTDGTIVGVVTIGGGLRTRSYTKHMAFGRNIGVFSFLVTL